MSWSGYNIENKELVCKIFYSKDLVSSCTAKCFGMSGRIAKYSIHRTYVIAIDMSKIQCVYR
jgi:hypothetical protein